MEHPIFKYSEEFFGGTETMARGFIEKVLPEMKNIRNYTCIIIPGWFPEIKTIGTTGEKYIFWIHNNIAQFSGSVGRVLNNDLVRRQTSFVVAVSEWERRTLSKELNLGLDRIITVPNAIEMLTPKPNKFKSVEKVKIVHASSAYRGMEVLLNAVPLMKEDFELNIFNEFYPDVPHNFNKVAVNDPRVNFWGKTPRKMVYKFFEESHIHAYPSTYPETSCLTQMEALSAGCYAVYSDLGALPETSMGHGVMIPFNEMTPERYAEELDKAIRKIKSEGYDYTKQVEDMNNNFSWDRAKQNWLAFDATI
jgi:glycosyltransferase involved in cell wall biosynthesis